MKSQLTAFLNEKHWKCSHNLKSHFGDWQTILWNTLFYTIVADNEVERAEDPSQTHCECK